MRSVEKDVEPLSARANPLPVYRAGLGGAVLPPCRRKAFVFRNVFGIVTGAVLETALVRSFFLTPHVPWFVRLIGLLGGAFLGLLICLSVSSLRIWRRQQFQWDGFVDHADSSFVRYSDVIAVEDAGVCLRVRTADRCVLISNMHFVVLDVLNFVLHRNPSVRVDADLIERLRNRR